MIYLARWIADGTGGWRPPGNPVAIADLRGTAQMFGFEGGWGCFGYPSKQKITGAIYLAADPREPLGKDASALAGEILGLDPAPATVRDMLWRAYTEAADVLGELRPRPLIPQRDMHLALYFGQWGLIRLETFALGVHPHSLAVIEMEQQKYRITDSFDRRTGRRLLDDLAAKYHVHPDTFIPADMRPDNSATRETSVGDTFARSFKPNINASSEGKTKNGEEATWLWEGDPITEWRIEGSALRRNSTTTTGTSFMLRCAEALSSSDQQGKLSLKQGSVGTATNHYQQYAPCIRLDDTDWTCYFGMRQWRDNMSTTGLRPAIVVLRKSVESSRSSIGTECSRAVKNGEVVSIKADGSSISLYLDDTLIETVTDTSISAGVHTGLYVVSNAVLGRVQMQDFFAEDIDTTVATGRHQFAGVDAKVYGLELSKLMGVG